MVKIIEHETSDKLYGYRTTGFSTMVIPFQ